MEICVCWHKVKTMENVLNNKKNNRNESRKEISSCSVCTTYKADFHLDFN